MVAPAMDADLPSEPPAAAARDPARPAAPAAPARPAPARPARARPARASGPLWPLLALALATALPEAVCVGADLGLWGSPFWRVLAYQYGGFWAGLWHGWQPNYAAQPWVMILTYPFLHAGPGHLAGNLAGLWLVGGALRPRQGRGGQGTFEVLALWAAGVLGGGLGFGLLATSPAPMVGASGAVFGLVGGWWVADLRAGKGWRSGPARAGRAAAILAGLAAANAAMAWATPGGIAWETHLGGFAAGAGLAALRRRRA